MTKKICFWAAVLSLLAISATGAWANDVEVTMDFTVTGASACGSGGTSACVDTLMGSFIWNTSTNSIVGTPSVTITGPLDYGMLTISGPISFGSVNALEASFQDPGGDYATFAIFFSSSLNTGTYPYDTTAGVVGTVTVAAGKCISTTDNCLTYFPTGTTTFDGTVTITPVMTTVPEPGTMGFLSTGLVGIAGLFRRRFLS